MTHYSTPWWPKLSPPFLSSLGIACVKKTFISSHLLPVSIINGSEMNKIFRCYRGLIVLAIASKIPLSARSIEMAALAVVAEPIVRIVYKGVGERLSVIFLFPSLTTSDNVDS
jgi:hypothetical protein